MGFSHFPEENGWESGKFHTTKPGSKDLEMGSL